MTHAEAVQLCYVVNSTPDLQAAERLVNRINLFLKLTGYTWVLHNPADGNWYTTVSREPCDAAAAPQAPPGLVALPPVRQAYGSSPGRMAHRKEFRMIIRHGVISVGLMVLTGTMLVTARPEVHAEVIRRVHPDGSVSVFVPQHAPSPAVVEPGPCSARVNTPETFAGADRAYHNVLARLRAVPEDLECRAQLVRLGRIRAELGRASGRATVYDETAIANDLNALTGSPAR